MIVDSKTMVDNNGNPIYSWDSVYGLQKVIEEDSSTGITYVGYSVKTAAKADATRSIERIYEATVGTVTTTETARPKDSFSKASSDFEFVRNDRATYSYVIS